MPGSLAAPNAHGSGDKTPSSANPSSPRPQLPEYNAQIQPIPTEYISNMYVLGERLNINSEVLRGMISTNEDIELPVLPSSNGYGLGRNATSLGRSHAEADAQGQGCRKASSSSVETGSSGEPSDDGDIRPSRPRQAIWREDTPRDSVLDVRDAVDELPLPPARSPHSPVSPSYAQSAHGGRAASHSRSDRMPNHPFATNDEHTWRRQEQNPKPDGDLRSFLDQGPPGGR